MAVSPTSGVQYVLIASFLWDWVVDWACSFCIDEAASWLHPLVASVAHAAKFMHVL